jgi:tetratricopeptide (TPR) repeat protein
MNTSKVIDLNNHAVAHLQQGRHKEALDLLRAAIADLKDNIVVRSSCSSPETALPNPSATMSVAPSSARLVSSNGKYDDDLSSHMEVDQNQDKPSIFSVPLWTEESFTRRQDETSIFMYAQAFLLAHTDHSDELLIGVVLYNMALVNHARSIEKDSSSHLTVALKYYGMAAAITQSRNGGVNASDYWLLLALYNNMAQIYLSQVCSEKLCLCLGSIRTFLDAERSEEVVDLDDYSFFLTNAMLQLKVVAAPAA